MEGYRWRLTASLVGVLTAVILLTPNFFDTAKVSWWPAQKKLNYGLDIQGGLHLVMGVDINGVMTESASRLANSIKKELSVSKEPVVVSNYTVSNGEKGEITFEFPTALDADKAEQQIMDKYGVVLQTFSKSNNTLVIRYLENQLVELKSKVIAQSIETIRNRIDEFGVAEPSISQQGSDRILVQLPGMTDAENAKKLINTTAKLDFMIVNREVNPADLQKWVQEAEKAGNYSLQTMKFSEYTNKINQDLKGKLPEKTVVYFGKSENAVNINAGAIPYALKTDTDLGGSGLDDAAIGFGQFGEPEVTLSFNPTGAAKFAEVTGANIGQQMAIVLDKVVKSAPNIQTRIGDGNARITLGSVRDREAALAEAKMISMALRAGSLPATLEQLEERRVGPTLGADSIKKAQMGAYVGSLLVILFLIFYYRGMGLVAAASLGVNILSVFGLLTALGATLTLPGIAGIALTVGFAVDANVLIQERIKDELLKGAGWKMAIKEGYHRAMSAILDSNVTVAATGVILLYFGTGPVKGFAVTLLIGIITTLFGNVFVSKVIVDTLIFKWNFKNISIGLPAKALKV